MRGDIFAADPLPPALSIAECIVASRMDRDQRHQHDGNGADDVEGVFEAGELRVFSCNAI